MRLDSASAYSGAVVSPFYDSLLVKVGGGGRVVEWVVEGMGGWWKEGFVVG